MSRQLDHGKRHNGEDPSRRNIKPAKILCHLDQPAHGQAAVVGSLRLIGWAHSKAGITAIIPVIDRQALTPFVPGLERPDVLAQIRDQIGDGCTPGFDESVRLDDLPDGEHDLELLIRAADGAQVVVKRRFSCLSSKAQYRNWLETYRPGMEELAEIRLRAEAQETPRRVMVWLGNGEASRLRASLNSLREQAYPHWVCAIVGEDMNHGLSELLDAWAQSAEERARFDTATHAQILPKAMGEREAASLFLMAGECLCPQALHELISRHRSGIVYSDHDLLDKDRERGEPYFTPEWSPDLALARDYVGGVYLVANTLFAGADAALLSGTAWRYRLFLQLTERTTDIARIPQVLWTAPAPGGGEERFVAERRAVEECLYRRGAGAIVSDSVIPGSRRLHWEVKSPIKVSIIIPTTGKIGYLRPCLDSILEKTEYDNFEFVILDNGHGHHPEGIDYARSKGVTVIDCPEPFNWSRLNNIGARAAQGELLLFLNDDIEAVDGSWLREMVGLGTRPGVASVGALLLYPNGAIQHAGIFLVDHGGGARHLFHKQEPGAGIYQNLDVATREVIASTGACLMVSRKNFELVGGFDEALPIVGNDLDLCLRLHALGLRNLWTPYARLIHHESISRKAIKIEKDELAVWERWGELLRAGDPYYNPNLTLTASDCSLRDQVYGRSLQALMTGARADEEKRGRMRHLYYRTIFEANRRLGRHLSPSFKNYLKRRLLPAPAAKKDDAAVSAAEPGGVNLIGYLRAEMGVGEGARGVARSLEAAGVPFAVINFEDGNPSRMGDLSWRHKEVARPVHGVNLLHVNADLTPFARGRLPATLFAGRYTIGFWAWELPDFPDEWLGSFDLVDEVWVPSTFVQQAVALKAPVPVIRIPHAIELQADPGLTRAHFGLPEGAFLFLSMYDTYSIVERKNPYGAIAAFREAFAGDDRSVGLVIKVNNIDGEERKRLQRQIGDYRNILILDRVLDRSEINALLHRIDCFVSLHRSEGFGLGPAEAMSLGKVAMLTNWSGNTDYMTPANCIPIDYTLTRLGRDLGPYKSYQRWAEPDLKMAAGWMERLTREPELVTKIGGEAKRTMAAHFSPLVVGEQIKRRLRYIGRRLGAGS